MICIRDRALCLALLASACSSEPPAANEQPATSVGVGGATSAVGPTSGGVSVGGASTSASPTVTSGAVVGTTGGTIGSTTTTGITSSTTGAATTTGAGGTSTTSTTAGVGGTGQIVDCALTVTSSSVSEVIPTVGIVEWDTDLAGVDDAFIEFGLDENYGQRADVDLAEPNHRTLVLGMKPSSTYHYRVVASGQGDSCQSADATLETGAVPSSVQGLFSVDTPLPDQVADGYLITSFLVRAGGPVLIADKDRDLVWWYTGPGEDVFRARMSYDGKWMWFRNTANNDTGEVYRVTMDGMSLDSWDLPTSTHDLAVMPDEHVALLARANNGCDEIWELDPETDDIRIVANLEVAYGSTNCHLNALIYYAPDDAFIVSDYIASSYIKVARESGNVIWVLNGDASDFSGTNWVQQHSMHVLSRDRVLIFNNGPQGQPSALIQFQLDEQAMTAQEVWRYGDGPANLAGGDVQRLYNGNTLGTYSAAGVILEVNEAGQVVQELSAGQQGIPFSHSVSRRSLYGPPPRIEDFDATR